MKKSKRLAPIQAHKRRQEDEAAKQLADVSQAMSLKKKSLSDLKSYQGEYDKQFLATGSEGMSAKRMKDYHVFMANLGKVLEQQKMAITTLEEEYEEKKRQWLSARSRTKALKKVQESHLKQEGIVEEKQLQKEQDDRGHRSIRH